MPEKEGVGCCIFYDTVASMDMVGYKGVLYEHPKQGSGVAGDAAWKPGHIRNVDENRRHLREQPFVWKHL